MAFAKLSGSLLARDDTRALVSVPVAATGEQSPAPSLATIEKPPRPPATVDEPECRDATYPLPLSIPEPRMGPVNRWRGVRLISFVLCVAAISACGFFIDNYVEAWRATRAPDTRADNRIPKIVEPRSEAALAVSTDIAEAIPSASTPDERSTMTGPSTYASVPDSAAASPAEPGFKYADNDALSANVTPAPEPARERGLSETKVAALMERGDRLFSVGDVASARLFYQYAAEAGDGGAALRLGEAFDPTFLERARLGRVQGDAKKALYWYLRAKELGTDDAEILAKSLRSASKN